MLLKVIKFKDIPKNYVINFYLCGDFDLPNCLVENPEGTENLTNS